VPRVVHHGLAAFQAAKPTADASKSVHLRNADITAAGALIDVVALLIQVTALWKGVVKLLLTRRASEPTILNQRKKAPYLLVGVRAVCLSATVTELSVSLKSRVQTRPASRHHAKQHAQ